VNACFCCVRFSFFIRSQETGSGKRLRNDLFCVEWDVKPQLSQLCSSCCFQDQSGDSSRDFSSPATTPTPVRKNRRKSNLFSVWPLCFRCVFGSVCVRTSSLRGDNNLAPSPTIPVVPVTIPASLAPFPPRPAGCVPIPSTFPLFPHSRPHPPVQNFFNTTYKASASIFQ